MIYYKTTSYMLPSLIDITSSPTTVYLRKNIEQISIPDYLTNEERTIYQFDEAAITKDEYIDILRKEQEITNDALQELILSLEG